MATRAKSITKLETVGDDVRIVTWTGLLNGDDGDPFEMPGWPDRSIQVLGTFGVGGTIVFEGSNDGTNYVTLTDPQGNTISKTAAALEAVSELTRRVRPRVTGGDGTTSLTAVLLVRR
jgi:hypothetical protein